MSLFAAENYCQDQGSWKEWQALVAKHPDDMDLQTLHALRLGLCAKVERGELTVQEATTIFESARDAIIINNKISAGEKEGATF